ncbi:MAG: GyrI-like domain-containing protein [Rhizomicrobium sp.]
MLRSSGILMVGAALAFNAVTFTAFAQSPPPASPPATAPAASAPAAPAPAVPPTPAPSAPGPETPAPVAPTIPTPPGDSFGVSVTLTEKTIIYFKGTGNWDAAFDTIVDGFKTVKAYMDKADIKPSGPPITVYTATDDTSFSFQAAIPIAEAPADPPKGDIAVGKSPTGKALKFTHRGSYDSMDTTYEAITNFLDEKQLDAKDLFIEEYQTDPVTTPEDKLVIDVYVPVK